MKVNEPVLKIMFTCQGCDFQAEARTGNQNNFDSAIRLTATHVRQTGHYVEVGGTVSPHKVNLPDPPGPSVGVV